MLSIKVMAACVFVLAALAGCGGNPDAGIIEPGQPGGDTPLLGGPPIAAPSSVGVDMQPVKGRFTRGDGIDFTLPRNGIHFYPNSVEFLPDWENGESGFSGLAYAMYSFDLAPYSGPPELYLRWASAPPAGNGWLGLARWDRDWWEWHEVTAGSPLVLESLAPYLNENFVLAAVVLSLGTTPSELSWVRIGGNLGPTADAGATLSTAVPNQPTTLNAGLSRDPDGEIVKYEWDTNGDGGFELDAGLQKEVPFTFETAGAYTVGLRVTDNSGASSMDSTTILVGEGVLDVSDFSDGWQGWSPDVADVFVSPGDEIYWEIERNSQFPYNGGHSIWMIAENRTDACKLWIEKAYTMEPHTTYNVSLGYKFGSSVAGQVGTWTIIAGASATDPETGPELMEMARESTYNGGVIGWTWLDKAYTMEVTTGPSGEVWVLAGVWGVMEVLQEYYVDNMAVQIVAAE